jgi:hypothetical protein
MYCPRQQRQQEIICHYLQKLYPRTYPDEHINGVIQRLNACTTYKQLLCVLMSKDFLKDKRLYNAFNQKLQELRPGKRLLQYQDISKDAQLPGERELYISIIKSLLPFKTKKEAITGAFLDSLRKCTSREQLADLVHSLELTKNQELDTIEKRYQELH